MSSGKRMHHLAYLAKSGYCANRSRQRMVSQKSRGREARRMVAAARTMIKMGFVGNSRVLISLFDLISFLRPAIDSLRTTGGSELVSIMSGLEKSDESSRRNSATFSTGEPSGIGSNHDGEDVFPVCCSACILGGA